MQIMPKMGFGTFIGLENPCISDANQRYKITFEAIYEALSMGYRHLDLAENYHNLNVIRAVLEKAFNPQSQGGLGLKRDDIWLTMKANAPFDENHIGRLLNAVGVSYFDLFLVHHPTIFNSEDALAHNWTILSQMKEQLHQIGVSNCYIPHLSRLIEICKRDNLRLPFANEIEVNILSKKKTLVQYCQESNIAIIAYSPLGYNMSVLLEQVEGIPIVAEKLGATPAQIALAWCMAKNLTVIPKSTNSTRILENWSAQLFVNYFQKDPNLNDYLDTRPDFIEYVTSTAEDWDKQGQSLTWKVTPKLIDDIEQPNNNPRA